MGRKGNNKAVINNNYYLVSSVSSWHVMGVAWRILGMEILLVRFSLVAIHACHWSEGKQR